jgi:hypothetical protein
MQVEVGKVSAIAESLRRVQQEGRSGSFAIFTADEAKKYYVQFAGGQGEARLYCEAVSNESLKPEYALTEEQTAKLVDLGWEQPFQVSGMSPNYSRDWLAEDDTDRLYIAQEVMDAFIEVYGVQADQPLVVRLNLE